MLNRHSISYHRHTAYQDISVGGSDITIAAHLVSSGEGEILSSIPRHLFSTLSSNSLKTPLTLVTMPPSATPSYIPVNFKTVRTRGDSRKVYGPPPLPDEGRVALVLAMIRVTDETLNAPKASKDPKLYEHCDRDTARIKSLEAELRMDVISFSDCRYVSQLGRWVGR